MKLVDISIKTPYKFVRPFNEGGTIWSVTQLYLSCLGSYETNECKKIVIEISDRVEINDKIEQMLNVFKINKVFDFDLYYTGGKLEKKRMILDVLQEGILSIARDKAWNEDLLKNAYKCCLERKLEHTWVRENKYILSPDKKHYAGVFCNWDSDKFEAFAIFLNKSKEEIKREKLFESNPSFVEPMGKMGWDKEHKDVFFLMSKDERKRWEAKL